MRPVADPPLGVASVLAWARNGVGATTPGLASSHGPTGQHQMAAEHDHGQDEREQLVAAQRQQAIAHHVHAQRQVVATPDPYRLRSVLVPERRSPCLPG